MELLGPLDAAAAAIAAIEVGLIATGDTTPSMLIRLAEETGVLVAMFFLSMAEPGD